MLRQNLVSNIAFQLKRRWLRAPLPIIAVLLAVALLVLAMLARNEAVAAKAGLTADVVRLGKPAPISPVEMRGDSTISLPPFTAGHLAETLDAAGNRNDVAIGAVAYTLEDGARHPYQRYRASFSLSAAYSLQRKVIADILGSSSAIVLDSVICARSDTPGAGLVCDVSVSAFYANESNG